LRAVDDEDQGVYDITITRDMVKSRINKLKEGKAPGDDGLTPVFLKNVAEEISEPLAMIFNRSLDDGIVPQGWKMANVTPVFNKNTVLTRRVSSYGLPAWVSSQLGAICCSVLPEPDL